MYVCQMHECVACVLCVGGCQSLDERDEQVSLIRAR